MLSIDTEMAWGMVHRHGVKENERAYARTREAVDGLLELLDKYEIRATWAMVGHLMLRSCAPEGGVKHPDVARPDYSWFAEDWFEQDPASGVDDAPFWYGPDILEQIRACRVPQEIGSHSFSHITVGDPGYSREAFATELAKCNELAAERGLELKSFVYPRNIVGHTDVLAEFGFTSYRGDAPCWYDGYGHFAWRIGHKIDNFLPHSPPVVLPVKEGGVWNIPASYYYPHSEPRWNDWGRLMPLWLRTRKIIRGVRKAQKQQRIFHLWFHPYNIASNPERLLKGLDRVLSNVAEQKAAGALDVLSMGDLAEQLSASEGVIQP